MNNLLIKNSHIVIAVNDSDSDLDLGHTHDDNSTNDNDDDGDIDLILTPRNDFLRYVAMDAEYPDLDKLALTAESLIWPATDIQLNKDCKDWKNKLTKAERTCLEFVLAFFAVSDGIVAENLVINFYAKVHINEARRFYATQLHTEHVHAQVYAMFITHLIPNIKRQNEIFLLTETNVMAKEKADWALKWLNNTETLYLMVEKQNIIDNDLNVSNMVFAQQLVAFAAVEMIFFSSSFALPCWFRSRGLMLGFASANDQIRRDEGLHGDFAAALFSHLKTKPKPSVVWKIITQAVHIEQNFVRTIMPIDLGNGMTQKKMCQYVRFIGDFCLRKMGVPNDNSQGTPHYGDKNPLACVQLMDYPGMTAFFERSPTDYSHFGGASGNRSLRKSNNGIGNQKHHQRQQPDNINRHQNTASKIKSSSVFEQAEGLDNDF